MKIYVASRFANIDRVKSLQKILKGHGHEITTDWTTHEHVQPVTDSNRSLATQYAIEDVKAVLDCEIFVLLTTEKTGAGSTTEFGAALLSSSLHGKPKVYVIGPYLESNLFYLHPSVTRKQTIEEVVEELNN